MNFLRKHPQVIAYTVLVLMNCLGWYFLQANAEADRDRAYEGSVALCQASYDTRQTVVHFVEAQTAPLPVPAAPPEAVDAAKRSNERRAQVRADAVVNFGPPECIHTLGLRVDANGRLVPL